MSIHVFYKSFLVLYYYAVHSMLKVAKYVFSLCETSYCNDRADIYNIQY